jgi:uncharacterized membrane protein
MPITIGLAALLHLAAIWFLPQVAGRRSVKRLREFAGRTNVIAYRGLPVAGRRVLTANPDMATAFGVYDLAGGPVRVRCVVPFEDQYWSVALYDWATENFWAVNDRSAGSGEFDLVIIPRLGKYSPQRGEQVAVSPSLRGVIAVRMIVNDRDNAEELARVERDIRKTVISGTGRAVAVAQTVGRGVSVWRY